MGNFMDFAKILEGKIRKEVESNLISEGIQVLNPGKSSADCFGGSREIDTHPAHLAFLMSQVSIHKGQAIPKKSTYPKPTVKIRPPHFLTEVQIGAFQFFIQMGSQLHPNFSSKELKQQFWLLAKLLHPDYSKDSGLKFIELKAAYKALQQVVAK
jgi:hypothetical protein